MFKTLFYIIARLHGVVLVWISCYHCCSYFSYVPGTILHNFISLYWCDTANCVAAQICQILHSFWLAYWLTDWLTTLLFNVTVSLIIDKPGVMQLLMTKNDKSKWYVSFWWKTIYVWIKPVLRIIHISVIKIMVLIWHRRLYCYQQYCIKVDAG